MEIKTIDGKAFVPTEELAKILDCAESTLMKDRCYNTLGIPFFRFGRSVKYRVSDVMEWAEKRKLRWTGDKPETR